jgi:serine/threonine protein kinase
MNYDLFISYRRNDTREAVSSIYQALIKSYGSNEIFADMAAIEPGNTWPDDIQNALKNSKIVLAIIGKDWLGTSAEDKNNLPRICDKEDWVRKEVEMAIDLNKKIIPVLIGIDKFPDTLDLPEKLKKLANIQFFKINIQPGESGDIKLLKENIEVLRMNLKANDEIKAALQIELRNKYGELIKIGSSNKANIYLGRDNVLDRLVAIKVIMNDDYEDEFIEIIKDAVKINGIIANSISVLKISMKKPLHVIMRYFQKGTLRQIINEQKAMQWSFEDVKSILVSMGKALVKIHKRELSYCNLKPSNILLNDDLEPYLNAFSRNKKLIGSYILEHLRKSLYTNSENVEEELCYLPPELFSTKAGSGSFIKRGEKIDQYMLGLVGYELLTGTMPKTITRFEDLEEKGNKAFKSLIPIQEIRNDCPSGFAAIIHTMLDYNPDKRFTALEEAIYKIDKFSFDAYEIANESYARCLSADNTDRNFFQTFYKELIKISPLAAKKFEAKHIGEDPKHKQYHILREAIFILLMFGKNNLEKNANNVNVLTRIAGKHGRKGYKVTKEEYDAFKRALTNTICGSESVSPFDEYCKISDDEKEIIKGAWFDALTPGIEYMIGQY